jgi:hypothetical protein
MFRALLVFLVLLSLPGLAQNQNKTDVIVYGGTAGGVMAAIAAAQEGATVVLVEPGQHLGGMLTGGLSHTDYGDRAVIGGLALTLYEKVAALYKKPLFFWRGPEPHLGEALLRDWLKESKVRVVYGQRVQTVQKENRHIRSIELGSGETLSASVFIDATYEGDLMARAGVSYAIGRESIGQYGESWAGRQPYYPDGHNFRYPISPFVNGKNGKLLPLINDRPQARFGEADSAVQAYCFRLLMTNNPANRVPISRPVGYDSSRYELLRRYLKIRQPATLGETGVFGPHINLPNQKAEINSGGPISTNLYDGSNWAYPDAGYSRRDQIWNDHLLYTQGLLYFIMNDPSVPEKIRKEASEWGLCKDEFADTGHWPHQLYVRVARRMIGEYVLTQQDLEKDVLKYDAIGMGTYNIDVRHVQRTWQWVSRFPELKGEVINEGYLSIPVKPYEVPYRSLTPKFDECTNLLVPVCISSSALAYASFRMEPQYMIAGHSAGVAAAMASRQQIPVQKVDIAALQKKLLAQRQVLSLEENPNGIFQEGKTVVVDDDMVRFLEKSGTWYLSEDPTVGRYQITYLSAPPNTRSSAVYRPFLPQTGTYRVYGWWPSGDKQASRVPLEIHHVEGVQKITLNQRQNGGSWNLLSTYRFEKGQKAEVNISNEGADGAVALDAFKFELLK